MREEVAISYSGFSEQRGHPGLVPGEGAAQGGAPSPRALPARPVRIAAALLNPGRRYA